MAQTRKKRQTKHRGNAAGVVEVRGRTSRPPSPAERKRQARAEARSERLNRPPSWSRATRNSALVAVVLLVLLLFTSHRSDVLPAAAVVSVIIFGLYIPAGYYIELFMWKRRMKGAPVKRGR